MADDIEVRVRKWTQEKASQLCKTCEETCCNGFEYNIQIKESELGIFQELGIPVIRTEDQREPIDFSQGVYTVSWLEELYTVNGDKIPKPSLVQVSSGNPHIGIKAIFLLYVGKDNPHCPLYDEQEKCTIYDDSRRPNSCYLHPVYGDRRDFFIKSSCKPFNQRSVREDFRRTFPEARLGVNNLRSVSFFDNANLVEYGEEL